MVGQRIQNADARNDTVEFINGKEVRVRVTENHGVESKTFYLCARMSVDMFYTQFKINENWGEMLLSEDNVVLTYWASCNTDKTLRQASGSPN